MSARGASRVLLALGLAGNTAAPTLAQEPGYVRRLGLPVVDDAIGYPRGVTADLHAGEVFVADTRGNRILIFDSEGLFVYELAGGELFGAPRDLAVGPEGHLLVVANHHRRPALVELDFDGLFLREIVPELPDGTVEPRFVSVALSPDGERLYLVDAVNLLLWIGDRDGVRTAAVDLAVGLGERERHDVILGHVDVYGEAVLLAVPSAREIRRFDLDGTFRKLIGIGGTAPCQIAFPVAAALTENGEVVIVDQQRMLVLRWNSETNRCLGEYLGLGASPGFLYYPTDLALDRSGQIFVSQGYQGRVQMYSGMAPAAPPPPSR